MVGYAGSPMCVMHVDVNLTRFKVKLAFLVWSSKMMVDYDSTGPSLHLFQAIFLNFSHSWQSRDFEVRIMLISPGFISALPEAASL